MLTSQTLSNSYHFAIQLYVVLTLWFFFHLLLFYLVKLWCQEFYRISVKLLFHDMELMSVIKCSWSWLPIIIRFVYFILFFKCKFEEVCLLMRKLYAAPAPNLLWRFALIESRLHSVMITITNEVLQLYSLKIENPIWSFNKVRILIRWSFGPHFRMHAHFATCQLSGDHGESAK